MGGEADDCWICHCQGSPESAHAVSSTRPWSEGNPLLLRHRRRWHRSSERGRRTERIENGSGRDRGRLLARRQPAKEQLDSGAGLSPLGGELVEFFFFLLKPVSLTTRKDHPVLFPPP